MKGGFSKIFQVAYLFCSMPPDISWGYMFTTVLQAAFYWASLFLLYATRSLGVTRLQQYCQLHSIGLLYFALCHQISLGVTCLQQYCHLLYATRYLCILSSHIHAMVELQLLQHDFASSP